MTEAEKVSLGSAIAVVEDDGEMRDLLQDYLFTQGFEVRGFPSASEFLGDFRGARHCFSLVISDVYLPGMNGLDLLPELRNSIPAVPVVLITAAPSSQDERLARKLGAEAYLQKPFRLLDLLTHVQRSVLSRSAAFAAR